MTTKGDSSRPFRLVGDGGNGDGSLPEHWPCCPDYLSETQRRRFYALCQRLEDHQLLESADVGDLEALAVAEDNLEQACLAVNLAGRYVTTEKEGRPYQCPACKGSGVRPLPRGREGDPAPAVHPRKPTGRPCSTCTSPNRAEIDSALGRGESFGSVSKRFETPKGTLFRHKRNHLGKPATPVLVDPADRTCLGCRGLGVIVPKTTEMVARRPEVGDQRKAIDQIAMLSAKLGLDVTSRARVKGSAGTRKPTSKLQEIRSRRAIRE